MQIENQDKIQQYQQDVIFNEINYSPGDIKNFDSFFKDIKKNKNKKPSQQCTVCFTETFRNIYQNSDDGLKTIICIMKNCQTVCHLRCYGLEFPKMKQKTIYFKEYEIYFMICQACRAYNQISDEKEQKDFQLKCIVCEKQEGTMKQLNNCKEWCHITCGLFTNEVINVISYDKMQFQKSDEISEKKKIEQPCFYCYNTKNTRSCNENKCQNYFHIYCLLKQRKFLEQQNKHQKCNIKLNFSQNNEVLQKKINIKSSDTIFLLNLNKTFEDIAEILDLQKFQNWNSVKQEVQQKICNQIDSENQQNGKQQKQLKKIQNGLVIECPKHISKQKSCFCQSTSDELYDDVYVGCDCCLEWYHVKCLRDVFKLTDKELNSETFICPPCVNFFDHKKKFFKTISNNGNVLSLDFINRCKNYRQPKLELYDFIFFAILIEEKLKNLKIIENKKNDSKIVENIQKQIQSLPFVFSNTTLLYSEQYQKNIQKVIQLLLDTIKDQIKGFQIQEAISFQEFKQVKINNDILNQNKEIQEKVKNLNQYLNKIMNQQYKNPFLKELNIYKWQIKVLDCIKNKKINLIIAESLQQEAQEENINFKEKLWVDIINEEYQKWYGMMIKYLQENTNKNNLSIFNKKRKKESAINSYSQRIEIYNKKIKIEDFNQKFQFGKCILNQVCEESNYLNIQLDKYYFFIDSYVGALQNKNLNKQQFYQLLDYSLNKIYFSGKEMLEMIEIYKKYELLSEEILQLEKLHFYEGIRISEEQIRELIKKAGELPFKTEELKYLEESLQNLLDHQSDLQILLNLIEYDDKKYQQKKNIINKIKYQLKNVDQFYVKIEMYQQVMLNLNKNVDLDELQEQISISNQLKFNKKLINQLEEKFQKGQNLKIKFNDAISIKKINENQLLIIQNILQEFQINQLNHDNEKQLLQNMKKSIDWLKKTYIIFIQSNNEIDINIDTQIDQISIFLQNKNDSISIFKKYVKIVQNTEEGGQINHFDYRIDNIAQTIIRLLFQIESNLILNDNQNDLNINETKSLEQNFDEIQQSLNKNNLNNIMFKKWQQWRKKQINILDKIQFIEGEISEYQTNNNRNTQNQKIKIKKQEEFFNYEDNLQKQKQNEISENIEEYSIIQNMIKTIMEINNNIFKISRQSKSELINYSQNKINFKYLVDQIQIFNKLSFPDNSSIKQELQKIFDKGIEIRNIYDQFKVTSQEIAKYFQNQDINLTIQKQIMKNYEKLTKDQILEIKQKMIENCICFQEEINDIDNQLQIFEKIEEELNIFVQENNIENNIQMSQENITKINNIRQKFLRDAQITNQNCLETICNYELKNKVFTYFQSGQTYILSKWKKLIENCQNNIKDIQRIKLFQLIEEEYLNGIFVNKKYKQMKEIDPKVQQKSEDYKIIEYVLLKISTCKVDLQLENQYFISLQNEHNQLAKEFNSIQQKSQNCQEKINELDLIVLHDKICKLPIIFKYQNQIDNIFQQFQSMNKVINQYEKFCENEKLSEDHLQVANKIINLYKNQPIYSQFAETLNKSSQLLILILRNLYYKNSIDYDHFQIQIENFNNIDRRFRIGKEYQNLKYKIWYYSVFFVKKAQEDYQNQFDFEYIYELLEKGKDLMNIFKDEKQSQLENVTDNIQENINFLINLIKDIVNELKRKNQISIKDNLYKGFINIEKQNELNKIKQTIKTNSLQNESLSNPIQINDSSIIYDNFEQKLNSLEKLIKKQSGSKISKKQQKIQEKQSQNETQQISNFNQNSQEIIDCYNKKSKQKPQKEIDYENELQGKFKKRVRKNQIGQEQIQVEQIDNKLREQNISTILEKFQQNSTFKRKRNYEKVIQTFENKIFLENQNSNQNYSIAMSQINDLFLKLTKLPYQSKLLISSKFNIEYIKKMISNFENLQNFGLNQNFLPKIENPDKNQQNSFLENLSSQQIINEDNILIQQDIKVEQIKPDLSIIINENEIVNQPPKKNLKIEQNNLKNEDKQDNQFLSIENCSSTTKINVKKTINQIYPNGCIFSLGDIHLKFLNTIGDFQQCKIYTNDLYENIINFPQLDNQDLKYKLKIGINQLINLIYNIEQENLIQKIQDLQSKIQNKKIIILNGWVELIDSDQTQLSQLIQIQNQFDWISIINSTYYNFILFTEQQSKLIENLIKIQIDEIDQKSIKLGFIAYVENEQVNLQSKLLPILVKFQPKVNKKLIIKNQFMQLEICKQNRQEDKNSPIIQIDQDDDENLIDK